MATPSRPPVHLTRRGPNSWHTSDPDALVHNLAARPGMELWRPKATDTRCRNEVARLYHRSGARWETHPACIVVSTNGYVRTSGTDPARVAAILDAIAEATATAEPEKDAGPQVEQLALFVAIGGRR